MERSGLDPIVEWVRPATATKDHEFELHPLHDADGGVQMPTPEFIVDYLMQMASGEGDVTKGGDPEYRKEAHYSCTWGGRAPPGAGMTPEKKKAYGYGPYECK